jgi:hypothetical protein
MAALTGDVLAENVAMLSLARQLVFTAEGQKAGEIRVTLPLGS